MSAELHCMERGHRQFAGLRLHIAEDIRCYLTKSEHDRTRGDCFRTRLSAALTPEVFPAILHRVAHYLWANGCCRMAEILTRTNFYLHKVNISADSCIGSGLRLPHPAGVTFQGRAGTCVTIYSLAICCGETDIQCRGKGGPKLGDNVTIGAHAVVLGDVEVGSGTSLFYAVALDCDAPGASLVSSRSLKVSFRNRQSTEVKA